MITIRIKPKDNDKDKLHPQIQVAFVHILLDEYQGEDITINTVSPFIVEAFEVYSDYYNIDDIQFYLGDELITKENLSVIYDDLGSVFKRLNRIRWENDERK